MERGPFFCVLLYKNDIRQNWVIVLCFSYHIGQTCPVKEFWWSRKGAIFGTKKNAATRISKWPFTSSPPRSPAREYERLSSACCDSARVGLRPLATLLLGCFFCFVVVAQMSQLDSTCFLFTVIISCMCHLSLPFNMFSTKNSGGEYFLHQKTEKPDGAEGGHWRTQRRLMDTMVSNGEVFEETGVNSWPVQLL